jgi:hypothetical protein
MLSTQLLQGSIGLKHALRLPLCTKYRDHMRLSTPDFAQMIAKEIAVKVIALRGAPGCNLTKTSFGTLVLKQRGSILHILL